MCDVCTQLGNTLVTPDRCVTEENMIFYTAHFPQAQIIFQ